MTASSPPTPATVVIAANSAWNILNFRGALIAGLKAARWRVIALAPDDGHAAALAALGVELVPIGIDSSGTSIVRDGRLLLEYLRALRRLRPEAFLGFTVKPNIYGSLAARVLDIRTINNISGLGTAFLKPGPLNWLVSRLYRLALAKSARVFFQNPHDRDLFVGKGLVRRDQAGLIPGSGIDLEWFKPSRRRRSAKRPFRFLFVGRLLRDKGLLEYAEAARLLRARWPDVEFAILGFAGSDNRSAVPIAEVERWHQDGVVRYLGEAADVRPFLEESDCIVLPSYREGLPRSLLEASAMTLPMVATDVPGCRDLVTEGDNGLLCQPRSAVSLADALDRMLRLSTAERSAMGRRARERVERDFDQALVVDAYLEALG
jgi:glycosyltransferase involved in cell wall biosynthesis